MNRTPRKGETPNKHGRLASKSPNSNSKNNLSQSKDLLNQDTYFCHYKNAMYMGSTKIFQRDGRGILLHDDGTSAITSYEKDMLHGYNVLLRPNNSVVSANYAKNKLVDVAYKREGVLFYGRFNNHEQLDSSATIINYESKEILYTNARKGQIVEKTEERNQSILSKVFDAGNLDSLLPAEHIRNINFELAKSKDIEIVRRGSKITVGFTKNGFLNGLAFIVGQEFNNSTSMQDINYHQIQRGYYKNSQLSGLGERRFRNGNVYIGEFKNNEFEGTGILKNNVKKNWVSGQFERGNLTELGKYSNDGTEKTSLKILEGIHQRKTSWVSKEISLLNTQFLDNEINKIVQFKNNDQMMNLQARRQQMLKRIQDNFITDIDEEMQEAPIRTTGLMDSPLQKYLKTEAPQTTYKRAHQFSNNSLRSDSSNKLQSSRKKIFNPQSLSFRAEIPKNDSYHIEVHPVPIDDLYESRKSPTDRQAIERERTLQNNESAINEFSGGGGSAARNESSSHVRDSLALVGPKVHTFTADKNQSYERRPANKSPQLSYKNDSLQRRKEDIIESMYRRQLNRSLF